VHHFRFKIHWKFIFIFDSLSCFVRAFTLKFIFYITLELNPNPLTWKKNMSPRKKTKLQRSHKDHPNKANLRNRLERVQKNAALLRELAQLENSNE